MEQSNARAWGRAAGERAGVAAGAVARCALRAVAVNVVAVVAAPFLAACSDPGVGPQAVRGPGALRASASTADARGSEVIPDHYIVTFRDTVQDVPGLARRLAAEGGGTLRFTYTAALKGFAAQLPEQAAEALRRNPRVARVELDATVQLSDVQPNPGWGLDRIDQAMLPLDRAYSFASSGTGVSVYIIDSGIRLTHTEFGGRARAGFTAINDGRGTTDCYGHGTHVAGTVGGATYGVAKGVTLYAVRVFDCAGGSTMSGTLAGVDWVTRNRILPAVANMSMSGPPSSTLTSAIEKSIAAGIVYTVAAGNFSTDACKYSPSNVPAALTVGASDINDQQATFSNFGRCVDLFAPGDGIKSAMMNTDLASAYMSGTSMAAPHVAGAAALYLAANPTASPAAVGQALVAAASSGALEAVGSGSPNLLVNTRRTAANPVSEPPPIHSPVSDAPPVASFAASCSRSRCKVDASNSRDDHGIVEYRWDFGDGSAPASGSELVTSTHVYGLVGTYTVTLTVIDSGGQTSSAARSVSVRKLGG
jgi:subtilisin family serine protease